MRQTASNHLCKDNIHSDGSCETAYGFESHYQASSTLDGAWCNNFRCCYLHADIAQLVEQRTPWGSLNVKYF